MHNRIMKRFRGIILVSVTATLLPAQRIPAVKPCSTVLGTYPVDSDIDSPLRQRARFEIRACGNGRNDVQLLGFKAKEDAPSLIESGSHIELLIQTGTLLVMQMTAGTSSPTLVAKFQKGNPVIVGREDGAGGVTYTEDHQHSDYAIITIPQKTFPDINGKFPKLPVHRYRLKIWED